MTIDDLLAAAATLPLRDAAYAIWRQKINFERLEGRVWPRRDQSTPQAREKSMREIRAQIKHEHDFAQDGPTFDRLKRAHPHAADAELKQAIVAAVKFDDDCFKHFSHGRAEDFWEMCIRAVARAAQDHPDYLETTYRDARNWVAYTMK
jgi:epoxyqueuosine reductase QueG